jgi:hypothetical protein
MARRSRPTCHWECPCWAETGDVVVSFCSLRKEVLTRTRVAGARVKEWNSGTGTSGGPRRSLRGTVGDHGAIRDTAVARGQDARQLPSRAFREQGFRPQRGAGARIRARVERRRFAAGARDLQLALRRRHMDANQTLLPPGQTGRERAPVLRLPRRGDRPGRRVFGAPGAHGAHAGHDGQQEGACHASQGHPSGARVLAPGCGANGSHEDSCSNTPNIRSVSRERHSSGRTRGARRRPGGLPWGSPSGQAAMASYLGARPSPVPGPRRYFFGCCMPEPDGPVPGVPLPVPMWPPVPDSWPLCMSEPAPPTPMVWPSLPSTE